ncbi:MAG: hypothetical protein KGL53_07655 [Elusimicrobia bacterium]|nr:hypothetical protein [Elusimicrobiota bacterium]
MRAFLAAVLTLSLPLAAAAAGLEAAALMGARGLPAAFNAAFLQRPVLAAEVDLASISDASLRGAVTLRLGGRTAYVSGTFDRSRSAYLTVWVDGAAAPYVFDLRSLSDAPAFVRAGAAVYKVSLAVRPLAPMSSRIRFQDAGGGPAQELTLGRLLAAVESAGRPLNLGGRPYRLFYAHDVRVSGGAAELDPAARNVVLLLDDGSGLQAFLVPASSLPADRVAVFQLPGGGRAGLRLADGRLSLYQL